MPRCVCCHRYAPKAVSFPGGTKTLGDPVGTCAGHVAIEEARSIARLWKRRALDSGYEPPPSKVHADRCVGGSSWCEACNPGGVAYCQGPNRHPTCKGGPLHESMIERGCIECGAYPEAT